MGALNSAGPLSDGYTAQDSQWTTSLRIWSMND